MLPGEPLAGRGPQVLGASMASDRMSRSDRWNDVARSGLDQGVPMDLRVLVLTGDQGLADLVRSQAENLGCACTMRDSYDGASASIGWADAAVIDLEGDGL